MIGAAAAVLRRRWSLRDAPAATPTIKPPCHEPNKLPGSRSALTSSGQLACQRGPGACWLKGSYLSR
ncbi:hypothetical protein GCM10027610_068460 [Dactylosporangium cerinum]